MSHVNAGDNDMAESIAYSQGSESSGTILEMNIGWLGMEVSKSPDTIYQALQGGHD